MFDMENSLKDFEKEIKDILAEAYKPISKSQNLENEIVLNKICVIHGTYQKKLIEGLRDSILDDLNEELSTNA